MKADELEKKIDDFLEGLIGSNEDQVRVGKLLMRWYEITLYNEVRDCCEGEKSPDTIIRDYNKKTL